MEIPTDEKVELLTSEKAEILTGEKAELRGGELAVAALPHTTAARKSVCTSIDFLSRVCAVGPLVL